MDVLPNSEKRENGVATAEAAKSADSALSKVRDGRGGRRSGAGRKPDREKNQGASVPKQSSEQPPPVTPETIEFCRNATKGALRLVDKIVTSRIQIAVVSIDKSFEELSVNMAKEVEISEYDLDFMGDTVAALAAKYSFISAYAPEIAAVTWTTSYGARVIDAINKIRTLSNEVNAARKRHPSNAD